MNSFTLQEPDAVIVFQISSHLSEDYLRSDYSEDQLPREACRVAIRLRNLVPEILAGSKASVKVFERNNSQLEWKQAPVYQLNLGNRWRPRTPMVYLLLIMVDLACREALKPEKRSRLIGKSMLRLQQVGIILKSVLFKKACDSFRMRH